LAILLLGLLSFLFRMEKTAYRYASITPGDYRSHPAHERGTDYRIASFHRSNSRNSDRTRIRGRLREEQPRSDTTAE
jgi:hypothetical protein